MKRPSLGEMIRSDACDSWWRRLRMVVTLSIPAMVAQLAGIIMEFIDASMVGSLGANASASIALVSTSTWLFWGLCSACSVGFSVQVAHLLGAGDREGARSVLRQGLVATGLFSILLALIAGVISFRLPAWLGGDVAIQRDSTLYFLIFACTLPVYQMSMLSGGMLRSSGNMVVPGTMGVVMCVLDVVFNFFLIFPTRGVSILGTQVTLPGAGLGVEGAAIGTGCAELVATAVLLWYMYARSSELSLKGRPGSYRLKGRTLMRALRIGMPMGLERFITSAAQITLTIIVAPLGTLAIAANGFAITAESLCYMPGYGIGDAAQTLVGQSLGADKPRLARRFGYMTAGIGITVMGLLGALLYFIAPYVIGIMTPVEEIVSLGASALRIECFAEPMFAAAIVCYGVFVGAGDTVVPCCINLGCMWVVRIVLAALLAPVWGLNGVWLAMCIELNVRGIIFLIRLRGRAWQTKIDKLRR